MTTTERPAPVPPSREPEQLMLRLEVEEFLRYEAALLDDWRLGDWLTLFADDCRYVVPATDARDVDPKAAVSIVDDDADRLAGRVERLNGRAAYREFPWSRVRHLVTNVRLVPPTLIGGRRVPDGGDGLIGAAASFVVYRFRRHEANTYVGSYRYALARRAGSLMIVEKVARLDMEDLEPGTVSVIL